MREKSWGWKTKCIPLSTVPMAALTSRLEDLPASFSHSPGCPIKKSGHALPSCPAAPVFSLTLSLACRLKALLSLG